MKAETALYIGAGQDSYDPMAVQGQLIKDPKGYPYIPGSSIKGVLRSFLESVTNGCERGSCLEKLNNKDARKAKVDELKKEPLNDGINDNALLAKYIVEKSCLTCHLFGSGLIAGKLKISDAVLENVEKWIETDIRTGNAINRDTRTTVSGALFDTETIPAGTLFKFRLNAENLSTDEARCSGELMSYFAKGEISVGGRSRAGLGRVSVEQFLLKISYVEKNKYIPTIKDLGEIEIDKLADTLAADLHG